MKRCKGCGRTDMLPLGLNPFGEQFLACCPDNSYVEENQIAVEWFSEELYQRFGMKGDGNVFDELFEKAKEIQKDQMKFMFDCGRNFQLTGEGTFEQVYNETYKSE